MTRSETRRKRLWRWRNNPLRRRDDIVEAWIVLAVWAVVAVGGTVAGLVTAHAADDTFARQRTDRQAVRAVLLDDVPRTALAMGGTIDRRMTAVSWRTPEGSPRTDETLADTGLKAGAHITVWQDGQGRLTAAPPSTTEATIESGFLGTVAAASLAGLVFGTGAVVRWRLDRRRIDQWGREWDLVGPQWGHKTG
ncbi:Rv1733c family protein [Streptomyces sp. B21-101]|uniref:Rv1733c family protein n=1 Tax=Streptomyces sp. B21-101 TaxID=3039415 RepID=UPI002FF26753